MKRRFSQRIQPLAVALTLTLTGTMLGGWSGFAHAAGPYNEAADARAEIAAALDAGARAKTPVLLVFGANWCGDCKMLDTAFREGSAAPLIAKHFKVVKVDVGRYDKNLVLAEQYGVPLKKGIPAVAVLSPQGQPIYVTQAGELADARKMGDQGVYGFFVKVVEGRGGAAN